MKKSILFLSIILVFTGCLRNLNETEFFRKLEIKNPTYYDIIAPNKEEIEALIKEEVEEEYGEAVEWITYWGESRYACGDVISKYYEPEFVQVLGEYRLEGANESSLYTIVFVPDEEELLTEAYVFSY